MNELTRNSPLLRAKGKAKLRAQAGAEEACQFESGRSAPAACKFFVLDVSQIAKELGLPTCNEARKTEHSMLWASAGLLCEVPFSFI